MSAPVSVLNVVLTSFHFHSFVCPLYSCLHWHETSLPLFLVTSALSCLFPLPFILVSLVSPCLKPVPVIDFGLFQLFVLPSVPLLQLHFGLLLPLRLLLARVSVWRGRWAGMGIVQKWRQTWEDGWGQWQEGDKIAKWERKRIHYYLAQFHSVYLHLCSLNDDNLHEQMQILPKNSHKVQYRCQGYQFLCSDTGVQSLFIRRP